MVFARGCVAGQDLGDFRRAQGESASPDSVLKIQDALATGPTGEEFTDKWWQDVSWFFTCLATCNSVQVSEEEDGLQYTGMSPDEVALVQAAHDVGVVFTERVNKKSKHSSSASDVSIRFPDDTTKVYSILYELEFT